MKSVLTLAGLVGGGLTALALFAAPAGAAPASAASQTAGRGAPVFVQNDDPAGNTIVAYDRTGDGQLVRSGTYLTGGLGGVLSGSVVDHLASQGSLTYDAHSHLLFAVNAGSNTVTVFGVAGDRLIRNQVISSGGAFPVSVTSYGNEVYVLNARDGGSVQGYLRIAGRLVLVPAWHRNLRLNTSAPGQPDEFTSTPGQVTFTPDGRQLLVTTKNGGNTVEAFTVGLFGPSQVATVTSLPGTVPFALTFDARGHVVLSEAGPNAVVTFRISSSGALTQLGSSATGQAATCWIVGKGHVVYASNAGSGTLSAYAVGHGGALTSRGTTGTDAGTVDAAVSSDGRDLYVQTGGTGTVDSYRIGAGGSLTATGSVVVPNAVGGEGIVAL